MTTLPETTTQDEVPKPQTDADPEHPPPAAAPDAAAEDSEEPPSVTASTGTGIAASPPAPAPIEGIPELEPVEPAPEAAAAAPPPRERERVVDSRLAGLRAMFPDFDDGLLQSVLDSVNGNTDHAIDVLLGMSDPDYTSTQQVQAPQTQEELDEQLARTLMLEDERQEHEPRPQAERQISSGSERDTLQEFSEQFNKFAESGKRTIGSLFSKVKAKIQEFDQPAGGQSGWGVGGDTYPYDANQNPYPDPPQQQQQQGQYTAYQTSQQRQQAQTQAQTPAYYDPNATGDRDLSPPGSASATATGYDAAPASPPKTNVGSPQIDGGKLGMLPKRPVSLLRTNEPPAGGAPPSSDDDELEYAENPFEEHRK
ncbi:hypothetical protein FB45DRAFT_891442 [Roridomyces roridus]|uniref:CUE domain-containing protein n=1 Tax=Roridomyces roridus TaxID=1738132 RepID=A0AAD7CEB3_9AGAR|nr:hypothetical protein FB45DRAFT_891442 [Roridomyces roridus]